MIVTIDMHLRDERVFNYLRRRGLIHYVKSSEISKHFNCHRNTVRAIMIRLKQAGKIKFKTCYRGGYEVTILE